MPKSLYTPSGIVRDRQKPRVGVVSAQPLLPDFIDEFITDGIDLIYEQAFEETREQIKDENPGIDDDELDDRVRESLEMLDSGDGQYLLGAWVKTAEGYYDIDRTGAKGTFAATFSAYSNNVTVDWSAETKPCRVTSPCYVMADGSGPCGDLDAEGDDVVAYTLPADCFAKDDDDV